MPRLLLCSTSPRRRDLLARLGLKFEIIAPEIDESRLASELVRELPLRLARAKARAGLALARSSNAYDRVTLSDDLTIAIAADTVVSLGEIELSKPRDRKNAREILQALSGHEHIVTTGVCVLAQTGAPEAEVAERSCSIDTKVRFRAMSNAQLDWLANSGDGDDKAGGYALQGLASSFIETVNGSFTNVIGLPLGESLGLLEAAGVVLPWNAAASIAGHAEEDRR
jgi:septum formation protein